MGITHLYPAPIPYIYFDLLTKQGEAASLFDTGVIKSMVGIGAGQALSFIKERESPPLFLKRGLGGVKFIRNWHRIRNW